MGDTVRIETAGGDFAAYVARPGRPNGAAIVVIQEIFGVNAVMRDIADGLAGEGWLAVVPDLFWRIEPGIDITDKTEAEWKKAFDLYGRFHVDTGVEDIQATIAAARAMVGGGKVGAVGYCLGGLLAWLTAARTDVDASVSYYGVGIEQTLAEAGAVKAPLLMHIAEADKFVSPEAQAQIHAALGGRAGIALHAYPGLDHAFAREGGEHYDVAGAALANGRTADFFQAHLL